MVASIFPSGLALLGGIPTQHQDFAASIIFLIAYATLAPLVIFRLIKRETRCWVLIRPALFVQTRIGTWIIRAVMSKGNYASGWFIAEQITLLSGFVLLCEPALSLLRAHIDRLGPNHEAVTPKDNAIKRVLRLLQVALVAALALGIYAGTKFGDLNNPSTLSDVKSYRDANAIICLCVTIVIGLAALAVQFIDHLEMRNTLWIALLAGILTIPSAYKIALYKSTPPNPIGVSTKVLFYILAALPELIVVSMYLSTNLIERFGVSPIGGGQNNQEWTRNGDEEEGKPVTYGNGAQAYPLQNTQAYPVQHGTQAYANGRGPQTYQNGN